MTTSYLFSAVAWLGIAVTIAGWVHTPNTG